MTYKTFVINLSNLKQYYEDKKRLESETEDLLYIMSGVRGLSYDQVLVHGNPSVKAERWHKLDDDYNKKEKELVFINKAIEQVEETLSKMPETLKTMLVKKYIQEMTFRKIGMEYGYSDKGLWKYMRRETEKYL